MHERPRLHTPDWFPEFVLYTMQVIPLPGWPEMGTEAGNVFWDAIGFNLHRKGTQKREAFEALMRLVPDPPSFANDFNARLFAEVELILCEQQAAWTAEAASNDFSVTKQAAEDYQRKHPCPDCPGTGFATRYSWWPSKNAQGQDRPADSPYTYFCTCPTGRFLQRTADDDTRRKVGDMATASPKIRLASVPWSDLPDNQHRYRLADWDEENGQPKFAEFAGKTLSQITAEVNARTVAKGNAMGGSLRKFTVPSSTERPEGSPRMPTGPLVAIGTPIRTSSHQSSHSGAAASF